MTVGPATQMAMERRSRIIEKIVRDVAELPDRTSPPDQPDAMLVTESELVAILTERIPLTC